jgi:hypothetical protein
MIVGFLNNQLDNRGTGNATFDYALYNQAILKNTSRIFTFRDTAHNPISVSRFTDQFRAVTYVTSPRDISGVDVLYHIKSGSDDGFRINSSIRYAVHAVFDVQPHGDRYAAVSDWLSGGRIPSVPHIIDPAWNTEHLRDVYEIPPNAIVFGRHGGPETFDIPWVWEAIQETLEANPNVYFVFMNTNRDLEHPRIFYLEEGGPFQKRTFLNSCNAMIHARWRGETFGISVGEFAVLGKPVFTYGGSRERAHLEELNAPQYEYLDTPELRDKLLKFAENPTVHFAYMPYSPGPVMKRFREAFLD